ncbi:MAG: hypothetical protein V1824_04760 [archaeon]
MKLIRVICIIAIFLFMILPVYSISPNFKLNENNYFNEKINLGFNNYPQFSKEVNIQIISLDKYNLFSYSLNLDINNTKEIFFRFPRFAGDLYSIGYSFYDSSNNLILEENYELSLINAPINLDYYLCNEIYCKDREQDIFKSGSVLYLQTNNVDNKDLIKYNLVIKDIEDITIINKQNISLPYKLDLEIGDYTLDLETVYENRVFENLISFKIVPLDYSENNNRGNLIFQRETAAIVSENKNPINLNKSNVNEAKNSKSIISNWKFISFIAIVILIIIFFLERKVILHKKSNKLIVFK